ncbi:MAG: efflux RND transporter permease subunit, partial [Myxococcales bacterium]|nr:efflux RND transporter permease subunit [Myxococcales bacterium]
MPLGPGKSLGQNLGFVAFMIAALLAGFSLFQLVYRPLLRWCLAHKGLFLAANLAFVLLGLCAWLGAARALAWLPASVRAHPTMVGLAEAMPGLKDDFMPPFDEGSFLFMPTTTPHASIGQSLDLLQATDAAIAEIPEVEAVVGKLGRAESPLDPAPVMMFETIIQYLPEYRRDASGRVGRFRYDVDAGAFARDEHGALIPDDAGRPFRQWRDHIRSPDDIWTEITRAGAHPGLTGAPKLMPIKTRIVMLQSGMRAAVGLKIKGPDLETIERFGVAVEALLKQLPEIEERTVLADRIVGKPYLELEINRAAISRYGLSVADVQDVIQIAIGGRVLTRTVEGRERYPVRVRYMREER